MQYILIIDLGRKVGWGKKVDGGKRVGNVSFGRQVKSNYQKIIMLKRNKGTKADNNETKIKCKKTKGLMILLVCGV